MKMVLATQNDVKLLYEKLPEDIKNNPGFYQNFGYIVESMVNDFPLNHNGPLQVIISEDGKSVRVKDRGSRKEDHIGPVMETRVVDLALKDEGNLEIVETHGVEHEAASYERKTQKQLPYGSTVVMDKFYKRTLIDKEGIEQCEGTFSMDGWPLSYETFGNIDEFHSQLLSKGQHMPEVWGYEGPALPRYSQEAYISGVSRSPDNPAFALIYTKQTDKAFNPMLKTNDNYIGTIHSEWPHRLRVDHYEIFGKYEGGKIELLNNGYNDEFQGMPMTEVIKNLSLRYEDQLEHSETKRHLPGQYEVLKARLDAVNAKFKEQPEMTAGRSR